MRNFRTAFSTASLLVWILDFLALTALAESSEVHVAVFVIAGAVLVLCRLAQPRLNQSWLLGGLVSIILGTIGFWLATKTHPVIAVAHGAPLAHALLWLEGGSSLLGWRIGMGFIELIIASALTPDAFLPIVIILFVVVASVAISCGFLDRELMREAPEFRGNPLPIGFVRRSLGFALLTFLSSALIFPLLPRIHGVAFNFPMGTASTGYIERVSVSQRHGVSDENSSQVMLRIYPADGLDLSTDIYLGLLRGRVLERFNGGEWKPGSRLLLTKDEFRQQSALKYSRLSNSRRKMEIVREALSSEILPIPYGTLDVLVGELDERHPARPIRSGEWTEPTSLDSRVHYTVELTPNDLGYLRERQAMDPPVDSVHRHVPEALRNERMTRLAKQIFAGAQTDGARISKLLAFFKNGGFTAPDPLAQDESPARAPASSRLTPLEEFLFVTKEGHCEWFSSAAGVLLRLGGIPTRLVAGFRLTRGPSGGVLTVRSRDAHAWVEAWTRERGWIPLDPTPRILRGGSWFEEVRDSYDYITAYWYKYVVSYGDHAEIGDFSKTLFSSGYWVGLGQTISGQWASFQGVLQAHRTLAIICTVITLIAGAGITIFIWAFFPWVFSIRWKVQEGPFVLRRERIRMERLMKKKIKIRDKSGAEIGIWEKTYERARFGPECSAPIEAEKLRVLYREIRKKSAA